MKVDAVIYGRALSRRTRRRREAGLCAAGGKPAVRGNANSIRRGYGGAPARVRQILKSIGHLGVGLHKAVRTVHVAGGGMLKRGARSGQWGELAGIAMPAKCLSPHGIGVARAARGCASTPTNTRSCHRYGFIHRSLRALLRKPEKRPGRGRSRRSSTLSRCRVVHPVPHWQRFPMRQAPDCRAVCGRTARFGRGRVIPPSLIARRDR